MVLVFEYMLILILILTDTNTDATYCDTDTDIAIYAQIACEIDIRMLTSHPIFCSIFDSQVLGEVLDQKIQCAVLLGQENGNPLTTHVF